MNKTVVLLALAMLLPWGASALNYSLDVTVVPTDSGYVQLDPAGGSYVAGMRVALMPIPLPGYVFSHWETDLDGSDAPATMVMNGNKNVTAVFMSLQCALENVIALSPRDGSTIKVGIESRDLPVIFNAVTNCVNEVARVTFTLSGGWQAISLMPDQSGVYSVTGPSIANLGYGTHTLYVAATSRHQPQVVVEDVVTFTVESTAANVDNDTNGLPDNSFAALNADGVSWMSSIVVPQTLNRRLTMATRWEGPFEGEPDAGPIMLSVKDPARPAQIAAVSVPRTLLKAGESGILIVQVAPDLPTLLDPIEPQLIAAEPSILVGGGQYVEVSVIMSLDNGETYAEIDSGRFDDQPAHLSMKGLDVIPGSSYLIYGHETGFVRDPMFGDQVTAWQGEWGTDAIRRLLITNAAMEADVAFLSVFAPYCAPIEGPRISLSPQNGSTQDYGFVPLGAYRDATFTLRNVGGGFLSGTVTTTNDAFSVISGGGIYHLDPGEATRVTVRFMPVAAARYIGNLIFEGGGYATLYLRGSGAKAPIPWTCSGAPPSEGAAAPGHEIGDSILLALGLLALLLARIRWAKRSATHHSRN